MKVPFLDLTPAYAEIQDELDAAYHRVMASGRYILGKEVEAFEEEFAAYCGVRYCVGVGNGLEALHLSLRACHIGPGDEVIVPANTYIATWLAVSSAGGVPVPVEPDEQTYPITESLAASVLSLPMWPHLKPNDVKAIVAVTAETLRRALLASRRGAEAR